jgi:hypothetical protein
LKSVTEENTLDEFLNTAELAGTEFIAGKSMIMAFDIAFRPIIWNVTLLLPVICSLCAIILGHLLVKGLGETYKRRYQGAFNYKAEMHLTRLILHN